MLQYAALIEYDGTAYFGFQRQRVGQPTIQSELEQALFNITQKSVIVNVAGRTDSGVHALGQVIGFSIEWQHGQTALQKAMNANLPQDIVVLQIKEVSLSFHPRYDARRRAYEYRILNGTLRHPIQRLYSWHVSRPLNINRMNEAALSLMGIHDFATFGQPPQGESTVRELFAAHWQQRGDELVFFIEANAFLYRMVRSIVGSLKLVGDGSWTVEDFVAMMRAKARKLSGPTAPPHGLFLVSVLYDHVEFNN